MNILKTIEAKIKVGEEEVEVHAPEHGHYILNRLNEKEVEECGWVVPTQFNRKGVKVTCLESCVERWVINKVCYQFQHWPLVECEMDVNEFVKEDCSKFLASLDCKGVPM